MYFNTNSNNIMKIQNFELFSIFFTQVFFTIKIVTNIEFIFLVILKLLGLKLSDGNVPGGTPSPGGITFPPAKSYKGLFAARFSIFVAIH